MWWLDVLLMAFQSLWRIIDAFSSLSVQQQRIIDAFSSLSVQQQSYADALAALTDTLEALDQQMARFPSPPGTFSRPPTRSTCRRVEADADNGVPEGKTAFTRGSGTFNARDRLRFLGGRWHPDLLGGVWLVPTEHADEAERHIRLAERTGEVLDADQRAEKITCYACGKKYTPFELRTLKHAVPADWYCGCAEREAGPPPRQAQVRNR